MRLISLPQCDSTLNLNAQTESTVGFVFSDMFRIEMDENFPRLALRSKESPLDS